MLHGIQVTTVGDDGITRFPVGTPGTGSEQIQLPVGVGSVLHIEDIRRLEADALQTEIRMAAEGYILRLKKKGSAGRSQSAELTGGRRGKADGRHAYQQRQKQEKGEKLSAHGKTSLGFHFLFIIAQKDGRPPPGPGKSGGKD